MQALADVSSHLSHACNDRLILSIRHGEELGRMRQHGTADHGRYHDRSPLTRTYRVGWGTTRRWLRRRAGRLEDDKWFLVKLGRGTVQSPADSAHAYRYINRQIGKLRAE